MTIERVLNTGWWVQALLEHRKLDVEEHSGERAHQKRDPDAHELHGPDHELTDWERAWITARVNDAHVLHLTQRNEGRAVLAEPEEEHHARELEARARSYFGAPHEETRRKFHEARAEHQRTHDTAHEMLHRKHSAASLEKIDAPSVTAVREQIAQTIKQIDEYVAPGGLIDRHIATVRTDVAEARRQAQKKIDDCAVLLSVPYENHVERELARVQDELRKASKA